ncbi:hypothetical protein A3K42_00690 [candidate division WWE3 bacterium RBG_13_37_7]|uniref:Uncharacterized protein n=1 Tax=candidate division WWE3 bacterium RBG_13_37_7 TaxID=1802609 RepID=A0A1F4U2D7_UNCKA|nr:MAG: hypothetical protein A3K42_00690 [candidate division WWE3 bacterium RBG_13_37_7]
MHLEIIKPVYAEAAVKTTVINPLSGTFSSIGSVFGFVINLIIGVGWGMVFIMLALGFIKYVTSKGEKQATENAQNWLTYAVIGGIGLFAVMLIRTFIFNLLGLSEGAVDVGGGITKF